MVLNAVQQFLAVVIFMEKEQGLGRCQGETIGQFQKQLVLFALKKTRTGKGI
jgi:hypothetical protein